MQTTMSLLLLLIATFVNQAYTPSRNAPPSPVSWPIFVYNKFTFPSFNRESCGNGGLICTGLASSGDGVVNLAPDLRFLTSPVDQVGRILYKNPMLVWLAIISTTFTFRIIKPSNSSDGADGLTFIMAPNASPSPLDSFGSYLRITNPSLEGVSPCQLAMEFDTYMNTFDIDGNHIGIVTNSVQNPIAIKSLNYAFIELKSGRDIKVQVEYNGRTKWLQVYLAYTSNPLMSILRLPLNISAYVPRAMYVGFTASIGSFFERHQILNWEFTSTPIAV